MSWVWCLMSLTNDWDSGIKCMLPKLVDDTKLGGVAHILEGKARI